MPVYNMFGHIVCKPRRHSKKSLQGINCIPFSHYVDHFSRLKVNKLRNPWSGLVCNTITILSLALLLCRDIIAWNKSLDWQFYYLLRWKRCLRKKWIDINSNFWFFWSFWNPNKCSLKSFITNNKIIQTELLVQVRLNLIV